MPFLAAILLSFLFIANAASSSSSASCTTLIASQDVIPSSNSASWFDGLSTYHVPTSAVPASPKVPANSTARDMVFDSTTLTFSVSPVNPQSSFSVALTFLDDATGYTREMSFTVGSVAITPSITLPPKTIYTSTWDIITAAVTGNSTLKFVLTNLKGPNAILSSFQLFSCTPTDPPISPKSPPSMTHDLPRLTPRPISVDGVGEILSIDLMGTWQFNAAPSSSLLRSLVNDNNDDVWTNIIVPGEYTMQGFRITPFAPVVYQTTFIVPAAWTGSGLGVKLRADGIYSNATIFINGASVGNHLGGFTPFEFDITAFISSTQTPNNITIIVVGVSLADTLAKGSQYATHDLGGITRKIYLFVAPTVNIADVHVVTSFPNQVYTAANLFLNISVANDNAQATTMPTIVNAVLTSATGTQEATGQVTFDTIDGNTVSYLGLNLSVTAPALWDPEHPNLHNLTLTLTGGGGGPSASIMMRIGFRDVVVAGNQILVNGHPIKAHGTTRHETHPIVSRALWTLEPMGKQWERDIIAFRDININYIRTSHYPPAEELMQAADELGMFIELEMPFVWASDNTGVAAFNYTVTAQREAMVFNRNHPSVIFWSLGNESPFNQNFANSLSGYLREVDSTRPFMFDGGDTQPIPPLDIYSRHYPTFSQAMSYANATNPTLFGEYAHLNCYNRRELATDPGVRDIWGLGIEEMWEIVYKSQGVLGACYWAGIDDYFYMPGGQPVGYGEWGVLDSFRRSKPETYLVRNMYSPVRLLQIPPPGTFPSTSSLILSNRFDFSDLSSVIFSWTIIQSNTSGYGNATGAPRSEGNVLTLNGLPSASALIGDIEIEATSSRGFLVNSWTFPLQPPTLTSFRKSGISGAPPTVTELPDGRLWIQDAANQFSWFISINGSASGNTSAGGDILIAGPTLMVLAENNEGGTQLVENMPPILPFNDALTLWTLTNRTFSIINDSVVVLLTGSYAEAEGLFTLSFDSTASMQTSYNFKWISKDNVTPRQVGLVFYAPSELASLSWRRTSQWASTYPIDHIGRPAGDNVPSNVGPVPGNVTRPWSWANDPSPLGDADFRSTRHNITVFEIGTGDSVLAFTSVQGNQHGRVWIAADGTVGLLAADLSNEGDNPFSRERVLPRPTYSNGDIIVGTGTSLQLGSALRY